MHVTSDVMSSNCTLAYTPVSGNFDAILEKNTWTFPPLIIRQRFEGCRCNYRDGHPSFRTYKNVENERNLSLKKERR